MKYLQENPSTQNIYLYSMTNQSLGIIYPILATLCICEQFIIRAQNMEAYEYVILTMNLS